MLKVNLVIPTL